MRDEMTLEELVAEAFTTLKAQPIGIAEFMGVAADVAKRVHLASLRADLKRQTMMMYGARPSQTNTENGAWLLAMVKLIKHYEAEGIR